jgi:hypothetical protein
MACNQGVTVIKKKHPLHPKRGPHRVPALPTTRKMYIPCYASVQFCTQRKQCGRQDTAHKGAGGAPARTGSGNATAKKKTKQKKTAEGLRPHTPLHSTLPNAIARVQNLTCVIDKHVKRVVAIIKGQFVGCDGGPSWGVQHSLHILEVVARPGGDVNALGNHGVVSSTCDTHVSDFLGTLSLYLFRCRSQGRNHGEGQGRRRQAGSRGHKWPSQAISHVSNKPLTSLTSCALYLGRPHEHIHTDTSTQHVRHTNDQSGRKPALAWPKKRTVTSMGGDECRNAGTYQGTYQGTTQMWVYGGVTSWHGRAVTSDRFRLSVKVGTFKLPPTPPPPHPPAHTRPFPTTTPLTYTHVQCALCTANLTTTSSTVFRNLKVWPAAPQTLSLSEPLHHRDTLATSALLCVVTDLSSHLTVAVAARPPTLWQDPTTAHRNFDGRAKKSGVHHE